MITKEHFRQLTNAIAFADIAGNYENLVRAVIFTKQVDGTIWLAGNGGSATTAAHIAADFRKACKMRSEDLVSNIASSFAYANDKGFYSVFWNQLEGRFNQNKDMLILISASGRSKNIRYCGWQAKQHGLSTFLLTGHSAPKNEPIFLDHRVVRVKSDIVEVVEDAHLALLHQIVRTIKITWKIGT